MNSNPVFPASSGSPKPERYGAVSQILHWLTALGIFVMLALGWGHDAVPGPWKPTLINAHKSLGLCLLALIIFRLIWRFFTKNPRLPPELPRLMALTARIVHAALYVFSGLMPLSGWVMVSAMGRAPSVFGWFSLPPLMEKNHDLVPLLKDIHEWTAWALVGLIVLHTAAALYHALVLKDGILQRMLP